MLIYTTTLVLILCATLVLTSSVSKSETNGFTRDNHVNAVKNVHDTSNSSSGPISLSTMDKYVKNESHTPIMAEGGPIYRSDSTDSSDYHLGVTQKLVAEMKNTETTSENSLSEDSKSKLPKTRNASVVARKGVIASSKITARKGVGPESLPRSESTTEKVEAAKYNEEKKINSTVSPLLTNDTVKLTTEKKLFSNDIKLSNISTNGTSKNVAGILENDKEKSVTSSTTMKIVPTIATNILKNQTTMTRPSTTKKFKAKPTVTIGEMDIDKPIPASPTKTPPLGMPRKIDYIVPVIITIMALPLLGGATFFLYRRGRDCWDKRHYRRMDFLIDGMYNDYSWK